MRVSERAGFLLAVLVLGGGLAGCAEGVVEPVAIPVVEWSSVPADPSLRLLAVDQNTGLVAPARRALRSAAEWESVWADWVSIYAPTPETPAVDFDRDMVLVAVLGERPSGGYAIAIDSVAETATEVVVHVRTLRPDDRCVTTAALTEPAVAVAAPASSRPVRFVDRHYVSRCD